MRRRVDFFGQGTTRLPFIPSSTVLSSPSFILYSLFQLFIFRISRMSDMVLDTKDTIRLQGCECHAGNLHKVLWGSDKQITAAVCPRGSWEMSRTSCK